MALAEARLCSILKVVMDSILRAQETYQEHNPWVRETKPSSALTIKQFPKCSVQFSHSVVYDYLQPHGLHTACQAFLSMIYCRSLLKFMSIESLTPSNHFIPCHSLLLLPSIFQSFPASGSFQ